MVMELLMSGRLGIIVVVLKIVVDEFAHIWCLRTITRIFTLFPGIWR